MEVLKMVGMWLLLALTLVPCLIGVMALAACFINPRDKEES